MLTLLLISVLFQEASALVDAAQSAKLSCYLVADWTIFDLRRLESVYDYTNDNLTWNFCKFTQWPLGQFIKKADTFAYLMNDTNNFATPITNGALVPQLRNVIEDNYGNKWI